MRSAAAYLSNPTSFDWPLIATQHSCCRLSPKQSGWSTLVDITHLFFLRHTSPIWPANFVPMQQNSKSVRRGAGGRRHSGDPWPQCVWVSTQVSSGNRRPKMDPDGCSSAWTIVHKWFYNFKHYISLRQSTGSLGPRTPDRSLSEAFYDLLENYLHWKKNKLEL